MTNKQKEMLDRIITALSENCRDSFREIAEYAVSLGYLPTIKGVRKDYADFTNSKLKKTIIKINTNPDSQWLAIKFYALPKYTGVFQNAINERLAYWNKLGYEARCFDCGKCDGTQGYKCTLSDGKQGFLCGFGLIPLSEFRAENVQEVKSALKTQDEFFRSLT